MLLRSQKLRRERFFAHGLLGLKKGERLDSTRKSGLVSLKGQQMEETLGQTQWIYQRG
jgi:hypothetical protein